MFTRDIKLFFVIEKSQRTQKNKKMSYISGKCLTLKGREGLLIGKGTWMLEMGYFLTSVVITKCLLYNEILYEIYMKFYNEMKGLHKNYKILLFYKIIFLKITFMVAIKVNYLGVNLGKSVCEPFVKKSIKRL